MRLLGYNDEGDFSLTDSFGDETPQYAILSHTWEAEEVTFKDLMDGTGKGKAGYRKIQFCREQARHDGLQYFWVDTCCIDKSSSAELAEAINSMFQWYSRAVKCYAYLSDVSVPDFDERQVTWESDFRNSRWFTRGWTLQELIAPASVEFFSSNGKRLGDRTSLVQQIHEITGIASGALQGVSLSMFSIDERFSWAAKRQTSRKEDKAYCLLGIFDVYLSPIYGEGDNAFNRLKAEIAKVSTGLDIQPINLPYARDAPFNSLAKQHDPLCLENTRVDIVDEIYKWADGEDERCIFWLNGLAGTGKSTIARTIARTYFDRKRLGASFFFSRGSGDVGYADKFFTSLAVQLAGNIPQTQAFIFDTITEQNNIANQSLRDQWHQLILRPLSRLNSNLSASSYVLIVDALDECDSEDDIRIILQLLSEAQTLKTVRLRVFLTSRPEIHIRHSICQIPDTKHRDFVLHNISSSIINHDISIFLQHNLNYIARERSLGAGWPGRQIVNRLVHDAGGLFIWAATACRFILEGKRFATKRLDMILESSSTAINAPEKHLNEIYLTVLRHSISPEYTAEEAEELCYTLKSLLGSIATLFSPLSTQSLSKLVNTSQKEVDQTLDDLHAILDISEDQTCPLRLHHPSFRDFLLDKDRCKDPRFWVDERQAHQTLADSCIRLMSSSLKQDIYNLDTPGVLVTDVASSRVEQCLPPEVQYACLYWIQHLQKSRAQLRDNDQVHQFLQEHLLHWFEALGWMGKVSEGIHAIASLETITTVCDSPRVAEFVYDAKRFVLYNRPAIEQAPLQTYCSALVFVPSMSIVRKQFKHCVPRWIRRLPKIENNWNALLQTLEGQLEGHSSAFHAIAFSLDGKLLASVSGDKTIKLWDASSGAVLQTLEGHSDSIFAMAFSLDSQLLASASRDRTVKLWDTSSGVVLQTLEGHLDYVCAVAFSPDGKLLASASSDWTVKLWDTSSGVALQTLEGHLGSIFAIAFSLDGKLLASASGDRTVKLWDTSSGVALQTLKGYLDSILAVAFSPDSKLLASASNDKTVKLWDTSSGVALQTLEGHLDSVLAVAFSLDSKLLASASRDKIIKLWDTSSGVVLQTLEGYSDSIFAMAFSPDGKLLASASRDGTVKLYDTSLGVALQTLKGYSDYISAIAFSPDSKLLASVSDNRTVKLWDTSSRVALETLEGHSDSILAMAFSLDGKLLASASRDNTIKLWDTSSGVALQTLEGYSDSICAIAFSPDSKLLVSALYNGIIKLWDTSSGVALQTLKGHSDSILAMAFSVDIKLLASASYNGTIKLWDTGSGVALQTLEGHPGSILAVAFSPDSKLLASALYNGTIKLWDTGSGVALQTLEGHSDPIWAVAFSPDIKLLASASYNGTIKLWDTSSRVALQTLEGHSDSVYAVAFSPDGKLLASASRDRTVKLWDTSSGVVLQTLEVGGDVRTLSFSNDGTFLQTNRGSLYTTFHSDSVTVSRPSLPYSVFIKDQWVSWGMENILRLPSEHRPSDFAVHGNIIGFGYPSGRVTFMEFTF